MQPPPCKLPTTALSLIHIPNFKLQYSQPRSNSFETAQNFRVKLESHSSMLACILPRHVHVLLMCCARATLRCKHTARQCCAHLHVLHTLRVCLRCKLLYCAPTCAARPCAVLHLVEASYRRLAMLRRTCWALAAHDMPMFWLPTLSPKHRSSDLVFLSSCTIVAPLACLVSRPAC
ncbi:hypothetical protein Pyn_10452 [Prunus yedoensis var. nudiflora]|uniref:Uncharacterized protein n=1 Tax=Prunus yedoensis var. nudiflora TaxID=2094558 RepID=A0A314ZUY5_PRUYE|nr:hypothetical protein Pyn_10452 [Prunus yedoensis var. nudiflora]